MAFLSRSALSHLNERYRQWELKWPWREPWKISPMSITSLSAWFTFEKEFLKMITNMNDFLPVT